MEFALWIQSSLNINRFIKPKYLVSFIGLFTGSYIDVTDTFGTIFFSPYLVQQCEFLGDPQGSHSTWKTLKTWKNDSSFSSHGNIMEFEKL